MNFKPIKFVISIIVMLSFVFSIPVLGADENNTVITGGDAQKLIIDPMELVLQINESQTLTVSGVTEDEKSAILWESQNDDIAAVDEHGTVTGIRAGKTVIVATIPNRPEEKTEIPVRVEETKIALIDFSSEEMTVEIKAKEKYQLTLNYEPYNATERPVWRSEDENIAQIDEEGLITAVGVGETRVIGEWNGKVQEITVNVRFSDVSEGKYYYEPACWALDHDITGGMNETDFMPDLICTRAQIVSFLWKINGSPEPKNSDNPFKDVSSKRYYYKPILWAYHAGLTTGTSNNTFSPDQPCSRAQVVQFIWGCQKNKDPEPVYFSDVKMNAYYYHAVKWAYHQKITAGTSKSTFSPNNACTRGQIVTFLYQCRNQEYAVYDPESVAQFNDLAAQNLDQIGWDLKAAFQWSFSIPYYGHYGLLPEDASPGAIWYADYGFKNQKGNCYVKASTFCEMAKMLGYDAHLISGYVRSTKGRSAHSWVEIDQEGSTYVYDLTSTSGGKSNGFKIVYGTKGTWQYIDYYRMN